MFDDTLATSSALQVREFFTTNAGAEEVYRNFRSCSYQRIVYERRVCVAAGLSKESLSSSNNNDDNDDDDSGLYNDDKYVFEPPAYFDPDVPDPEDNEEEEKEEEQPNADPPPLIGITVRNPDSWVTVNVVQTKYVRIVPSTIPLP